MAGKGSVADRVKRMLSSLLHKDDENKTDIAAKSVVLKNGAAASKSITAEDLKVNPRSKEAFFQRVATFSTLKWFAKPRPLLPPCCARYGWENTDTDILRCISCRAILCGKIMETEIDEKNAEHVKKIEADLISSHQKHCSWKVNPNPESFMQLEFSDRTESLENYLNRLDSVISLERQLPKIDTSFLKDFDADRALDLLGNLKKEETDSHSYVNHLIEQSACVIALCGWKKSSSTSAATVTCTFCQRQLGLWNFIDIHSEVNSDTQDETKDNVVSDCEHSEAEGEENGEPAQKKIKTEHIPKKQSFNPLTQHKPWCQWIDCGASGDSQSMSVNGPGWRRLLLLLIPDVSPGAQRPVQRIIGNIKTTPPHQGLKNIRQMFKDWSSPPKFSP